MSSPSVEELHARLLQSRTDGLDPYRVEASHMFGVAYDQVTPQQRTIAKELIYRVAWGLTPQQKKDALL